MYSNAEYMNIIIDAHRKLNLQQKGQQPYSLLKVVCVSQNVAVYPLRSVQIFGKGPVLSIAYSGKMNGSCKSFFFFLTGALHQKNRGVFVFNRLFYLHIFTYISSIIISAQ
jgi:hypothetical protein